MYACDSEHGGGHLVVVKTPCDVQARKKPIVLKIQRIAPPQVWTGRLIFHKVSEMHIGPHQVIRSETALRAQCSHIGQYPYVSVFD